MLACVAKKHSILALVHIVCSQSASNTHTRRLPIADAIPVRFDTTRFYPTLAIRHSRLPEAVLDQVQNRTRNHLYPAPLNLNGPTSPPLFLHLVCILHMNTV